MRATSKTAKLCRNATRRLVDLEELTRSASTSDVMGERDRLCAHAVIETANLWDQFCRSYYLSAVYGAIDTTGQPLCTGHDRHRSYSSAIDNAVKVVNPSFHARRTSAGRPQWTQRDEPDWKSRSVFRRIMQSVNPSNMPAITLAMGVTTRAFDVLPPMRNYFAHRGEDTGIKSRALSRTLIRTLSLTDTSGHTPAERASEVLLAYRPSHSSTLLEELIADVRTVVSFLT